MLKLRLYLLSFFFLFINVDSFKFNPNNQALRNIKIELSMENKDTNQLKIIKRFFTPAILGASLFLNQPDFSEAASSGSRSGGSSFRSSNSIRSSYRSGTALRSTTEYASRTAPRNNIIIAPIGGFGYSPFGFGGFGYNPFGFFGISPQIILLGAVAYFALQILNNRATGSDFSNSNEVGFLVSGSTLMKIQVALDADWMDKDNIINSLSKISSKNSELTSRKALSQLLSDASLALLRKNRDWNAVAYEGQLFRNWEINDVDAVFQKKAIRERSKFENELNINSPYTINKSKPTQVVVSLLVAVKGKAQAYTNRISSISSLQDCLQNLAADALTDDGDNILAVELLWTPSEPGNILTERDLIEDYPELIKL